MQNSGLTSHFKIRDIIQRSFAKNSPFPLIFFCFGHNFLPITAIKEPFSLLIYIFLIFRLDTQESHIFYHNWQGHYGHNGYFTPNMAIMAITIIGFV